MQHIARAPLRDFRSSGCSQQGPTSTKAACDQDLISINSQLVKGHYLNKGVQRRHLL